MFFPAASERKRVAAPRRAGTRSIAKRRGAWNQPQERSPGTDRLPTASSSLLRGDAQLALRSLRAPFDLLGATTGPLLLTSQPRRAAVFDGALAGIDFFAVVRMNPTPPGEVSIWLM
jgi:hypothetical protein